MSRGFGVWEPVKGMTQGMEREAAPQAGADPEVLRWLRQAVERRPPRQLCLIHLPAPAVPAERLWRADEVVPAVFWHSPERPATAGLGEAVVLAPSGPGRFASLSADAGRWLARPHRVAHPAAGRAGASLFGGFAFACGDADEAGWAPFGDARFVLPRWTYQVQDDDASLTLALLPGESLPPGEVEDLYLRIGDALARPERDEERSGVGELQEIPPRERWQELVAAACAAIREGSLAKVVLARRMEARTAARLDPVVLLGRLARHESGQYRFGVRLEGRTFLGATPELLVSRRGREVRSEALAGSAAAGTLAAGDGTALLTDPKQRAEHAFVVHAIRDALTPLCSRLEHPREPTLRGLRHLVHLATPFVGELSAPASVMEVAERLHPTPAVGGVPPAAAAAWIAAEEGAPRGWFAGPVGTLEPGGDGELAVALRCALLDGERLTVYAGSGIVAGSDPAAEYEETAAKARATLAALGLEP